MNGKSAIKICQNEDLINDINKVLERHGLIICDTYIEIESDFTYDLGLRVGGHRMHIKTLVGNIKEDEQHKQA